MKTLQFLLLAVICCVTVQARRKTKDKCIPVIDHCDPRVNPCTNNRQCEVDKKCCNAVCSNCPFPLVACKRNPCDDATCPKGTTCEANYCGGCNYVCRKPESQNCNNVISPCDPIVNPCCKNQECKVEGCLAVCHAPPLPSCKKSDISEGLFCTQAFVTFCKKGCKKCCENNNGCIPSKQYRFKKTSTGCKELSLPPKPMKPCFDSGISSGLVCTQATETFCNKGCNRCCKHKNGCIPNKRFRFNKKEDGQCQELPLPPKPLKSCFDSGISSGLFCIQVETTFCKKGCNKCCKHKNGCIPNKRFRFKEGADGKCQELPLPAKPMKSCFDSGISSGLICTQAEATFCNKGCNRCCKHKNGCIPNKRFRFKEGADGKCQDLGLPCPKGCKPIQCVTTPCDGCSCPNKG